MCPHLELGEHDAVRVDHRLLLFDRGGRMRLRFRDGRLLRLFRLRDVRQGISFISTSSCRFGRLFSASLWPVGSRLEESFYRRLRELINTWGGVPPFWRMFHVNNLQTL